MVLRCLHFADNFPHAVSHHHRERNPHARDAENLRRVELVAARIVVLDVWRAVWRSFACARTYYVNGLVSALFNFHHVHIFLVLLPHDFGVGNGICAFSKRPAVVRLAYGSIFISYNVKEADPGDYASRTTMCILPTNALHFGVMQLSYYESASIGVTLSNAGDFANELQFSSILGMLFFDILLYTFLGWYFDQVLRQSTVPANHHIFSFSLRIGAATVGVCGRASAQISPRDVVHGAQGVNAAMQDGDGAPVDDNFEPVSLELRAQRKSDRCVSIERLHKRFSTPSGVVNAVDNLSVEMYEGQIFCLLGHNGAGEDDNDIYAYWHDRAIWR